MMKKEDEVRVMVVDDHPMVRFGLATFLGAQPNMEVVAQASTGEEAIRLFDQFQPDVVLMDLRLPGISGVDAIRSIRDKHPESRFVGFDYHGPSIDWARQVAADAGVADRVSFEVAAAKDFPGRGYDLVASFDCLHDMGDPVGASRHVKEALKPGGCWMIVERP